mmetsp:Transcript_4574/g.11573  ORF Transcript_4574/g.11573 Transcript_4574/m.11573 type:complete len:251 (-) Transcript_4574:1069-1821(-)
MEQLVRLPHHVIQQIFLPVLTHGVKIIRKTVAVRRIIHRAHVCQQMIHKGGRKLAHGRERLIMFSQPPLDGRRKQLHVWRRSVLVERLVSQLEPNVLQVGSVPAAIFIQTGIQSIDGHDCEVVPVLKVPGAVAVHLAHTVVPRVLPVLLPGLRIESGGVGAGDMVQGSGIGALPRLQPASERIHSGLALANSVHERLLRRHAAVPRNPAHVSVHGHCAASLRHRTLRRPLQQIQRQTQFLWACGKGPHAF